MCSQLLRVVGLGRRRRFEWPQNNRFLVIWVQYMFSFLKLEDALDRIDNFTE
jgi:hypothetical protein